MNFPSIRIEGAILSPDILGRLDDAPGQRPADFGLEAQSRLAKSPAWAEMQTIGASSSASRNASPTHRPYHQTRQQGCAPSARLGYQLDYQSRGGTNAELRHLHRVLTASPPSDIGSNRRGDRKPEKAVLRMSAPPVGVSNLQDDHGLVTTAACCACCATARRQATIWNLI